MALDRTQKFAMSTGGQGVSIGDVVDLASGGGGGGSGVVKMARVALTSAQLLSAFSAPIVVIPSPGAGTFIQVIASCYEYAFNTTQYVASDNGPSLYYAGNNGVNADSQNSSGSWQSPQSFVITGIGEIAGQVTPPSLDGEDVVFTSPSVDMTEGDGTAVVTVFYAVVEL